LREDVKGYRILLGGKLGRHPQLGTEIKGVFPKDEVMKVVEKCLDHFMKENQHGERFGEILNRTGTEFLNEIDLKQQRIST
jgi:dissimilatory sulfite reductase (desulfoviridin) alpha/beta subunit